MLMLQTNAWFFLSEVAAKITKIFPIHLFSPLLLCYVCTRSESIDVIKTRAVGIFHLNRKF